VIPRRYFLKLLAGLPLLSALPTSLPSAWAQVSTGQQVVPRLSIGQTFAGEELHYDIAFWILGRVAEATMSFAAGPTEGQYISTIKGATVGFTGFVTSYRTDTYRSVMEEVDGGRRLRSISFEEQVKIGDQTRKRTHTFDHNKMKWIERNVRMSGATGTLEHDIPEGKDYNDFLTASYNFRYGVYGAMERGMTYHVPVFPKKDVTTYEVKVSLMAEENRLRETESVMTGSEYHVELAMDPEVLQSKKGLIKGWPTKGLYPVEGVMEDVFLFGDVRGTLVKRSK